jgi:hypothetical protein
MSGALEKLRAVLRSLGRSLDIAGTMHRAPRVPRHAVVRRALERTALAEDFARIADDGQRAIAGRLGGSR